MRKRLYLFSLAVSSLVACGSDTGEKATDGLDGGNDSGGPPTTKIDRSGLTDLGTGPLDYSDPNLWTCLPGNDPNECYSNLDATEFAADGSTRLVKHERAVDPKFDCFYVYPTVDLTSGGNTNTFADISHVQDALLSQGARFSRLCEVYAPLYRQQAIGVGAAGDGGGALGLTGDSALAFGDVEAAFDEYLAKWNKGRKFVLMGHSQGTFMLSMLVTRRFENDAALRAQLISALLIGGGPFVPEGQVVGGSFQNLPACTTSGEVGCLIAYNSFALEAPPPATALFGRSATAGTEVVCTAPGPLANNTGRSRGTYLPKVINTPAFVPNTPAGSAPAFDTPFALFPEVFSGECVRKNGFHYFEVSLDPPPGDQRAVAPYRSTGTEAIGFGLHVSDYNLFLDDLIEAVKLQADAALR